MRNQLRTIVLLGASTALFVGLGSLLGEAWLYGSLVLAAALNLGAYFFSDRIVLRMHGAREVPLVEAPALHGMVADLAAAAGIPKPRLFLIAESQPNAFATGRNPQHGVVAVTEGLLQLMDQRQVRGVIAHELAHIKNRDVLIASIAATFAAAISYVANAFGFAAMFGGSDEEGEGAGGGSLLMALLAPIAATVLQLAVSRSREFVADETGAAIAGDPEGLASALERLEMAAHAIPAALPAGAASLFIVNPFAGGGLLRLFSTHPPVGERVRRLRALARRDYAPRGFGARRRAYVG